MIDLVIFKMQISEFINMLLLLATAIGTFLVFLQWRADHRRSRQNFAVNLMMKWVDSLDNDSFGVRRFVESLDEDQCQKLENAEEFLIDEQQLQLAIYVLKREFPECISLTVENDSKTVKLNPIYSLFIRSVAVKWLNLLECIMAAWDQKFAHRKIIEDEFAPLLLHKDERKIAMAYFRNTSSHSYPCLNKFIEHAKANKSYTMRLTTERSATLETSLQNA